MPVCHMTPEEELAADIALTDEIIAEIKAEEAVIEWLCGLPSWRWSEWVLPRYVRDN